jgi:hypothetical protein
VTDQPTRLLRDAENYLNALHGSVARHDNLAANFGCAGCELRDRIGVELRAVSSASPAPATDGDTLRERIAEALIEWAYRGKNPEHGGILETVRANAYSRADAVLAVLPAPTDQTAREAQQDATQDGEAHPAEHTWAAELYDPLADEWVPGTRYIDRDRAVNHLAHAKKIGATWKDGTPTQRRLVRATTTYTVEDPAAVARPGQPETEARCPDAVWTPTPHPPHTWHQSPTHPHRPSPGVPGQTGQPETDSEAQS